MLSVSSKRICRDRPVDHAAKAHSAIEDFFSGQLGKGYKKDQHPEVDLCNNEYEEWEECEEFLKINGDAQDVAQQCLRAKRDLGRQRARGKRQSINNPMFDECPDPKFSDRLVFR